MKAVIEIELTILGEYKPEFDDELIVDAILESLDGMWFIGDVDDDRIDILAHSATCRLEGKP